MKTSTKVKIILGTAATLIIYGETKYILKKNEIEKRNRKMNNLVNELNTLTTTVKNRDGKLNRREAKKYHRLLEELENMDL